MKKKLLCVLLAAAFALTAVGCKGGDATVSFGALPWANSDYGNPQYEKTEYKVERFYCGGKEDELVAEGTYVSELTGSLSTAETEAYGANCFKVKNTFSLTYNQSVHAAYTNETGGRLMNAGLTDSYDSETFFSKESLAPVFARKTQNVAQRPLTDRDGVPFAPAAITEGLPEGVTARYVLPASVRYADPRGYEYRADYTNGVVQFATTKGTTTENKADGTYVRDYRLDPKEYSIKNNTRFDNEQHAYVVRAMDGCKRKGSGTFYLSSFYDSYVKDKYVRYTMGLSCADKNTDVTLSLDPAEIYIAGTEGELPHDNGSYTVSCVQASVSISSSSPGPAVSLLIADPSYKFAERNTVNADRTDGIATVKPVVRMTFTEYSYSSAKVNYRTVYTLASFHNRAA